MIRHILHYNENRPKSDLEKHRHSILTLNEECLRTQKYIDSQFLKPNKRIIDYQRRINCQIPTSNLKKP